MRKRVSVLLLTIGLLGALAFAQSNRSASPATVSSVQLVKAGRVLDVKTGTYLVNQGVLVENERIKAIGSFAEIEKSAPKNARVIDLGNATLLPGLIDCHTHLLDIRIGNLEFYENNALRLTQVSPDERTMLGQNNAREVLEAGFTTVRDMGDATEKSDVMLREAINAGRVTGPRMLVATKKLTPPNGQHLHQAAAIDKEIIQHEYLLVGNAEDARRGVREAINLGADFIKVIVDDKPLLLNLEELKAIVDEAHRAGLKVAAHAHTEESTKVAVEAGADSVEHAYKISDASLRMMHDKGIFLVATDFTKEAVAELFSKTLPPNAEQREEREQYVKEQVEYAPERLPRAIKTGVRIAAGSDLAWKWPGRTRGQQAVLIFDAYQRAGISAPDIIRAATMNASELLGWQDRVGTIEINKFADLIAVVGDPLTDISELQRVKFVMKGGAVVKNEIGGNQTPKAKGL